MIEIINELNNYLNIEALTADRSLLIAVIATAVIGVIYCFFGYKCVRFIAAVLGLIAGAAIGRMIVQMTSFEYPVTLIIIAACAVVFALIAALLYKAGVFLIVFLGIWAVAYAFLTEYTSLDKVFAVIIGLAVGVILAILCVIYLKPVIIVVTALAGGFLFSDLLFDHLIHVRWSSQLETLARLGAGALLALIGIIYQFVTTRDD